MRNKRRRFSDIWEKLGGEKERERAIRNNDLSLKVDLKKRFANWTLILFVIWTTIYAVGLFLLLYYKKSYWWFLLLSIPEIILAQCFKVVIDNLFTSKRLTTKDFS